MPEAISHETLEQDIIELEREITEKSGGAVNRETIRETMERKIYDAPRGREEREQAENTSSEKPGAASPLPSYAKNIPPEARLAAEQLLDLAWHKGLKTALKAIRKSDPLTMDLFHDAITERLYSEFKRRGILK